MNIILAKVNGSTSVYYKMLEGATLFDRPENLSSAVPFIADSSLSDDDWYKIDEFSIKEFCIDLLKSPLDTTAYPLLNKINTEKIPYIVSWQDGGFVYFQKVPKAQLLKKKFIAFGDNIEVKENAGYITINKFADAIYDANLDILYFRHLPVITSIFNGIDQLSREATDAEVQDFFRCSFIKLGEGFSYSKVGLPNRKRITNVKDMITSMTGKKKKDMLNYIHSYKPNLEFKSDAFTINNEDELKNLLWGLEERFFTTTISKQKCVANSIIEVK